MTLVGVVPLGVVWMEEFTERDTRPAGDGDDIQLPPWVGLWIACELFKSELVAPATTFPPGWLDDIQPTTNVFAVEEVA